MIDKTPITADEIVNMISDRFSRGAVSRIIFEFQKDDASRADVVQRIVDIVLIMTSGPTNLHSRMDMLPIKLGSNHKEEKLNVATQMGIELNSIIADSHKDTFNTSTKLKNLINEYFSDKITLDLEKAVIDAIATVITMRRPK